MIDHRIDGFLELQNLAAHIDGDLFGQVTVGHGDGHIGDIAHLRSEVAGHLVDRVGEILPHAQHSLDLRLASQFAFGADLTRHAGYFRREHRELLDHGIDQPCRAQKLSPEREPIHLEVHGLSKIAIGHRADGARDFGRGPHQIVDEHVQLFDFLCPSTGRPWQRYALLEAPLLAHQLAHPLDFLSDDLLSGDRLIEQERDFPFHPVPIVRQPRRECSIAVRP